MMHEFPPGELFPSDDLAPVTAESARYVYQLERVNRVVIGLRELDLSLGEKLQIASRLMGSLNEGLDDTRGAREAVEAQSAALEELIATVKALAEKMPDSQEIRWKVMNDIWESIEIKVLESGDQVRDTVVASAREAALTMLETVQRGYVRPERPDEGSSFGARIRFLWRYAVYRVRKFAADWLPIAIVVIAVIFVLQYGKTFLR